MKYEAICDAQIDTAEMINLERINHHKYYLLKDAFNS